MEPRAAKFDGTGIAWPDETGSWFREKPVAAKSATSRLDMPNVTARLIPVAGPIVTDAKVSNQLCKSTAV